MTDIPRLAWPVSLAANGQLVTVEQDSDDDIRQCVEAIVRHRVGDRVDVPEMGVPDFTHGEQPLEVDGVTTVIGRHEPRASVLVASSPNLIESVLAEVADINVDWTPSAEPEEA